MTMDKKNNKLFMLFDEILNVDDDKKLSDEQMEKFLGEEGFKHFQEYKHLKEQKEKYKDELEQYKKIEKAQEIQKKAQFLLSTDKVLPAQYQVLVKLLASFNHEQEERFVKFISRRPKHNYSEEHGNYSEPLENLTPEELAQKYFGEHD